MVRAVVTTTGKGKATGFINLKVVFGIRTDSP